MRVRANQYRSRQGIRIFSHYDVRNALIEADIMEASDTKSLNELATNDLSLRATAIRCRNAVIKCNNDLLRIGNTKGIAPVDGEKVAVVKNDSVDIDDH
jgi:hypothetical protein